MEGGGKAVGTFSPDRSLNIFAAVCFSRAGPHTSRSAEASGKRCIETKTDGPSRSAFHE